MPEASRASANKRPSRLRRLQALIGLKEALVFLVCESLRLKVRRNVRIAGQSVSEEWIAKVSMLAIELHDRIVPGCTEALERAVLDFSRKEKVGEKVFAFRA
jgi:hypothetical protein